MTVQIQLRRDTAANWTANNPTLAAGEFGYETDTYKFKVGDGATDWTSLAYFDSGISTTKIDDLAAGDDNTDLNASTAKHGLMMKYPNSGAGKYLEEDGTWSVPAGSGGTPSDTVASETTWGVVAAAGASGNFSRADHTHGTPALPKLDDLTAPDDNTDLNASTTKHGLMMKYPASGGGNFLAENGTWAVPPGGSAAGAPIMVAASNATASEKAFATASGGAVCDGTNDQVEILAALAACNGGVVLLSSGAFVTTGFEIADGTLRGQGMINMSILSGEEEGTKITTTGTIHVNHTGRLQDVRVYVADTYADVVVLVDPEQNNASGVFDMLYNVSVVSNGNTDATAFKWYVNASTSTIGAYLEFCSFHKLYAYDCNIGFHISCYETSGKVGYINSNYFYSLVAYGCVYPFKIEQNNTSAISQNQFYSCDIQAAATMVDGLTMTGNCRGNIFHALSFWDWTNATGKQISLDANTYENVINFYSGNQYAPRGADGCTDAGRNNIIRNIGCPIEFPRLNEFANYAPVPCSDFTGTKVSGDAAGSLGTFHLKLNSSTTNPSTYKYVLPVPFLSSGDSTATNWEYINWDRKIILVFNLTLLNAAAGSVVRVQLCEDSAIANLTHKGIGIYYTNAVWYLEGYGSSRGTGYGSEPTQTSDMQYAITYNPAATRMECYKNGIWDATMSTAANLPTGMGTNPGLLVFSIAGTGTDTTAILSNIRIWQER